MSGRLPQPLAELTDKFAKLPGLGPKSALRMAMALLQWPESETRRLGEEIAALRTKLNICSRCGGLAASDPCPVCSDPARGTDELCIVAEWDNILTLEEGGFYKGQYFVLGGLLAPLDQRDSGALALDKLRSRLAEGETREAILALGSTVDAENTASFLKSAITAEFPEVRVTRLAQGIPLGAQLKFMDKETLRQAMRHRQRL